MLVQMGCPRQEGPHHGSQHSGVRILSVKNRYSTVLDLASHSSFADPHRRATLNGRYSDFTKPRIGMSNSSWSRMGKKREEGKTRAVGTRLVGTETAGEARELSLP